MNNSFHQKAVAIFTSLFFFLTTAVFSQADNCTGATSISSSPTCVNTAGSLTAGATYAVIPSLGCGIAEDDVWYQFIAASNNHTVTLSSVTFANPRVQLFSGNCGALTSIACGTTSVNAATLTPGNQYFIRIYSSTNATGTFNICVTYPSNDLCGNAITINSSPGCGNVPGTLVGSSYTAIGAACGASAGNRNDVWYSFTARSVNPTITLSASPAQRSIQVYSAASCGGAVTSIGCVINSATYTPAVVIGTTYLVRIWSDNNTAGTFGICITDPGGPANDLCGAATVLTSSTSCVNTAGNIYASTTTPTGMTDPDCAGGLVTADVWYSFVAQTTNPTITISGLGSQFTSPGIQLLSNNCGGNFTSLFCGTTSINADYLTPGTTYLIRVYKTGAMPTSAVNAGFNICIQDPVTPPPFNDNPCNAVNLPIWNTCNNITGDMAGSTPTSSVPLGACAGPLVYDVWYKFTAINTSASISLSGFAAGTNFLSPNIQVFSGTCGSLTSIACGASPLILLTLTPGTTYYVRVYSTTAPAPNGNAGFRICATTALAPVRFGNTYVNVTRKTNGGVVQKGDTLEIRMTISHTNGTLFAPRYVDSLPTNTVIAPAPNNAVWIRTNEGLSYKQYTLTAGDDAAVYVASPPAGQYQIRMNLGLGGTNPGIPVNTLASESASATGTLINTNNPRGGGGLLFCTAFRVVVTGNPGDTIKLAAGKFLYQIIPGGPDVTLTTNPFKIVISSPLALCTNSVGINIASESGGTFGSGTAPNRSTDLNDPIDAYSFVSDVSAYVNLPDGRYSIVKNISPRNGTIRNARRNPTCNAGPALNVNDPNHCNFRMFSGYWVVDGDHTGTNNAIGNTPPARNTNGGYMLVVNADYVASEIYRQTITNLCPNTYYEFSAWVRNICPTCGIDSTGAQFAGTPTAPASGYPGVYPNLAFLLNDVDYYNTGEIDTVGWIKKGFVFKTGLTQTSATFSIRNNAQGGGGNDWALDDISVTTCFPGMTYSPSATPNVCENDIITITDTVRSIFDNYVEYKWQRWDQTTGGPWADIPGASGTATPSWNPSLNVWEFWSTYTIPGSLTTAAHDGDLYRLVVASTASNLAGLNNPCSYTDPVTITINVLTDCGPPLKADLLSATGRLTNTIAKISWVTSKEDEPVSYSIERSDDGINFRRIVLINGYNDITAEINNYSYNDPEAVNKRVYYRVVMISSDNKKKYSGIIRLNPEEKNDFKFGTVVNPFTNELRYEINSPAQGFVKIELIDSYGRIVKSENKQVFPGTNSLSIDNTTSLSSGIYILKASINGSVIFRKIMKEKK